MKAPVSLHAEFIVALWKVVGNRWLRGVAGVGYGSHSAAPNIRHADLLGFDPNGRLPLHLIRGL